MNTLPSSYAPDASRSFQDEPSRTQAKSARAQHAAALIWLTMSVVLPRCSISVTYASQLRTHRQLYASPFRE
eukprot:9777816-Alexandrium_andersonii.AAC.1